MSIIQGGLSKILKLIAVRGIGFILPPNTDRNAVVKKMKGGRQLFILVKMYKLYKK
jgi:hypothetical protein